ncbi:MTC1 Maintenance of telomere capping protein 1 [Candida maltosa Xu316]
MTNSTKDADVLDFINSLPDSKPNTPKPTNTANKSAENKEDILDFLDELAEHEKKQKKLSPKTAKKVESEEEPTTGTTTDKSDTTNEEIEQQQQKSKDEQEGEELELPNPISSITSWWNSEGSNKVNSIWDKIASNAEKISEQTYHFANETTNQLNKNTKNLNGEELTSKLNNLFINISSQIKEGLLEKNDEILNILIISDLYNLKYLNLLVYNNFNLVMKQVEGSIRVNVNEFSHHHSDDAVTTRLDEKETTEEEDGKDNRIIIETNNNNSFSFIIILKDLTNNITILTKTQPMPLRWAQWLDGEKLKFGESIDPKEWVKDWIRQSLNLSIGILAQEYVIKRMGV